MANHQESNPIDNIFQTSFGGLPTSPAANGWDTPSDQVWQGIQSGIAKPKGSWTLGSKVAATAAALLLVGAIAYFALPNNKAVPAAQPAPAVAVPQPATPVTAPTSEQAKADKSIDKPTAKPAPTGGKATAPAPTNEADRNQVERGNAKTPKLPNSVEKNRQQGATNGTNEQHK